MNSTRGSREGAYSGGHDFNPFPPPTGLSIHAARVPYLRLVGNPRQVCTLAFVFVFSCGALGWRSEQSVPVKIDSTLFRKYRQRRTNPAMIYLYL